MFFLLTDLFLIIIYIFGRATFRSGQIQCYWGQMFKNLGGISQGEGRARDLGMARSLKFSEKEENSLQLN